MKKNSTIKKKFGQPVWASKGGSLDLFYFMFLLNYDWKDFADFNLLLSPDHL